MEKYKKSVVPLGFGYEDPVKSIAKTLGNAVVFSYRDNVFVLTCRHLIEDEYGEHVVKAVLRTDQAQYFMVWNNMLNLRFHPLDTEDNTFDLALYYFKSKKQFAASDECVNLTLSEDLNINENAPMTLLGIASGHMTPESMVSSKSIEREGIRGQYLDQTSAFHPQDYNRKLRDQHLVRVKREDVKELAGGMAVWKRDKTVEPAGLITGSGTLKIKEHRDAEVKEVGIYSFTPFTRLADMLTGFHKTEHPR